MIASSDVCMDNNGGSSLNGNIIQIFTCWPGVTLEEAKSQSWSISLPILTGNFYLSNYNFMYYNYL